MRYWALILIAGLTCGPAARLPAADVGLIKVNGAIGPATASFIARAIDLAGTRDDACLVIQLDTPGGLLDSTKDIVAKLYESKVPTVVYVALGQGLDQMQALHGALNAEAAYLKEPFPYHPHITLAQSILEAQVPAVFELARYRWAVFPHERAFPVDRAVWVQCTRLNNWIDLDEDVLE